MSPTPMSAGAQRPALVLGDPVQAVAAKIATVERTRWKPDLADHSSRTSRIRSGWNG